MMHKNARCCDKANLITQPTMPKISKNEEEEIATH
jgi:hypothetical protein